MLYRSVHKSIYLLLVLPLSSGILLLNADLPYALATVLFYLVPAVALLFIGEQRVGRLRVATFSAVLSLPYAVVVDWIGIKANMWAVPVSVFPGRILGVIPAEDVLWLFGAVLLVISGYRALKPANRRREAEAPYVGWRLRRIALWALVGTTIFVLFGKSLDEATFNTPFAYLGIGTVFFAAPLILLLFRSGGLRVRPLLASTAYFGYVTALFEVVAAINGYWLFNGSYIAPQIEFGGLPIAPAEEIIFVGIVGPATAIAYFEALLSFPTKSS